VTPWVNDYIGRPFEDGSSRADACDCWGLVRRVMMEQFDVFLPSLSYGKSEAERHALVDSLRPEFEQRQAPEHGAIVLFFVEGRRAHLGVCIEGTDVLHMMASQGCVLTPLTSRWLANGISGYFVPRSR